ncbi:MAG: DUF2269 family protein [bacterium]
MIYFYLKTLHVIALVAWLGPAFGAYWLLIRMKRAETGKDNALLEKFYEEVVLGEHLAFLVLVGSGIAMVYVLGFDAIRQPWLTKKLYLVGGILLIEVFDFWIGNVAYRRIVRERRGPDNPEWKRWIKRRNAFYFLTIPLFAGLSLAVIYLAVLKPG